MLKKILAIVAMLYAAAAFAAVDVNKASAAELDAVKGIGPGISGKILDERKKGNFKDWNDFIERVKGIGEANAAKLSAEGVTVGGAAYKAVSAPAAKPAAAAAPAAAPAPAAKPAVAAAPAAAPAAKEEKKDPKAEAKAKADEAKAKKEADKKAKDEAKKKADDEAKAKKEADKKAKEDAAKAKKPADAPKAAASAPKK
jgi:competence protein ComEA